MRILALCPYVPFPPTHGGRIRSGVVLAALRGVGDVEVVAPVGPEDEEGVAGLTDELGIPVHGLPVVGAGGAPDRAPMRKLSRWLRGRSDVMWRRWMPEALAEARRLLSLRRVDLVVVETGFAIPLVPDALPSRETKLVFSTHNVEAEVLSRLGSGVTSRVEAGLVARAERSMTMRADLTIAVSERDRQVLAHGVPGARVEVVENSVDLARLEPLPLRERGDGGRPPRLLFVGSFDYPPNREAAWELLDAHLPALRAQWPDLVVRFVGRDPSGEVAARSGAVEGAEYVGFVEDLAAEYAAADAVYVPLRSGGGTRIKVLEAFALGRPVIATGLAVEGLPVECGRDYLGCERPAEGAASLRRVLEQGAPAMVERARQLVERRFSHAAATLRIRDCLRPFCR